MLSGTAVTRKIATSVAVGIALFGATVQLPAAPCLVTNTAGPKACAMGCCHNKKCCETSHQRTGPASQPLSKSGSVQTFAAIPAMSFVAVVGNYATDFDFSSSVERVAHSPSPLALSCIRLI